MRFCPDFIVYHARIYRPGKGFHSATALLVYRNRILLMGTDQEMLSYRCPNTHTVNAAGHLILPAFMDSHTHFLGYARRKLELDLSHTNSVEQALDQIRQRVQQTPPGEWIVGGGWDVNRWHLSHFPHRQLLDAISSDHFIALESKDWHTFWVNSRVLQHLGIHRSSPEPDGGVIQRDAHGEPTGILQENATLPVRAAIPFPGWETLFPAFLEAQRELHQLGMGSIHSMETPDEFAFYQRLLREQKMQMRVFWYAPVQNLTDLERLKISAPFGTNQLQLSGIKIFSDGSLGSHTAWLLEPYTGTAHRGVPVVQEEELAKLIERAILRHLNCAVHAIGDAANRMVLRVFARFARESRQRGLRHRIEHAQLIHPDDFPFFGKSGVIASVQPIHLPGDIKLIQSYWVGRERFAYAFRSLLEGGARLIFGSDTPIYPFNPWHSIYVALERRAPDAATEPFFPNEKLDLSTTLQAYTRQSALAVGMENQLGDLQPGMLADFFIPDRDITAVSPQEISDTRSLFTVVNGKIVWQTEPFLEEP